MIPQCPGCGGPAISRLCIDYWYPREEFLPEAADPWRVHGSAPFRTCGSPACGAAGLLAAMDGIITDAALAYCRLLDVEDLHIVHIGYPGSFTYSAFGGEP